MFYYIFIIKYIVFIRLNFKMISQNNIREIDEVVDSANLSKFKKGCFPGFLYNYMKVF